jgi:ubiquinone/menaquinone biosynthesis C-methylase UbiE
LLLLCVLLGWRLIAMSQNSDVAASYNLVADEYVRRIYEELAHKPLDRGLLDRFAASIPPGQLACDLGCGPGHVARYLQERGVHVCGIDLSPAMIQRARRLNPAIAFNQGDLLSLAVPDATFAGVAAFYAIVNLPPSELPKAFGEMLRCLSPGGLLLLSFHIGDETVHLDSWWGIQVSIDFYFFPVEQIAGELRSVGFEIEDVIERDPYPEVEHPSRRAYVFARKPTVQSVSNSKVS